MLLPRSRSERRALMWQAVLAVLILCVPAFVIFLTQTRNGQHCPRCWSSRIIQIRYGLQSGPAGLSESQHGQVYLAGCETGPERWYCKNCGKQW